MMAFSSEYLLNQIASACTTDWPGGLVFPLVDMIKDKCAPKDRMAGVERTRKLRQIALKSGMNPATLFEQIKAIDSQ